MGTDIYMNWKGMTKKEKDAQITGFQIYMGHVGYLRASIGMYAENELLHRIFPEEYWEKGDFLEYDFIQNHEKNIMYIYAYLLEPLISLEKNSEDYIDENIVNTITSAIRKIDMTIGPQMTIQIPSIHEIDEKIRYASSVIEFLWLGIDKQNKGLNPKVYISW
ncbi:MAG: hypothetical protein QXO65_03675 [Candidatus Aenigmatarchaeota archaeon]